MNIERRLSVHKRKLTNNIHHSQKLQNAWNKYGETNFIFEYESFQINSLEELSTLEKQYIKKYDSFEKKFGWGIGTCSQINSPKHFVKQKEIYKRLTEEEKEKILMQFVE